MAINTKYSVILDAARVDHEMASAHELNPEGVSLYKGDPEEDLSEVAPYLFSCIEKPQFLNWVVTTGWGKAWGVFAMSNVGFNELHRHFRRFLMVKTEDGVQLYFRFYDPRVLRIFLPTCDSLQLREFFGPVSKFVCEDEDPAFALIFFHDNTKLVTQRIPSKELFTTIEKEVIEQNQPKAISPEENIVTNPATIKTKESSSTDLEKTPETPTNEDPEKPKSRFKFY